LGKVPKRLRKKVKRNKKRTSNLKEGGGGRATLDKRKALTRISRVKEVPPNLRLKKKKKVPEKQTGEIVKSPQQRKKIVKLLATCKKGEY